MYNCSESFAKCTLTNVSFFAYQVVSCAQQYCGSPPSFLSPPSPPSPPPVLSPPSSLQCATTLECIQKFGVLALVCEQSVCKYKYTSAQNYGPHLSVDTSHNFLASTSTFYLSQTTSACGCVQDNKGEFKGSLPDDWLLAAIGPTLATDFGNEYDQGAANCNGCANPKKCTQGITSTWLTDQRGSCFEQCRATFGCYRLTKIGLLFSTTTTTDEESINVFVGDGMEMQSAYGNNVQFGVPLTESYASGCEVKNANKPACDPIECKLADTTLVPEVGSWQNDQEDTNWLPGACGSRNDWKCRNVAGFPHHFDILAGTDRKAWPANGHNSAVFVEEIECPADIIRSRLQYCDRIEVVDAELHNISAPVSATKKCNFPSPTDLPPFPPLPPNPPPFPPSPPPPPAPNMCTCFYTTESPADWAGDSGCPETLTEWKSKCGNDPNVTPLNENSCIAGTLKTNSDHTVKYCTKSGQSSTQYQFQCLKSPCPK